MEMTRATTILITFGLLDALAMIDSMATAADKNTRDLHRERPSRDKGKTGAQDSHLDTAGPSKALPSSAG